MYDGENCRRSAACANSGGILSVLWKWLCDGEDMVSESVTVWEIDHVTLPSSEINVTPASSILLRWYVNLDHGLLVFSLTAFSRRRRIVYLWPRAPHETTPHTHHA